MCYRVNHQKGGEKNDIAGENDRVQSKRADHAVRAGREVWAFISDLKLNRAGQKRSVKGHKGKDRVGNREGDKMKWWLDEIKRIVRETEELQHSNESAYTKERAKVHAYEEIKEVIRNESEHITS